MRVCNQNVTLPQGNFLVLNSWEYHQIKLDNLLGAVKYWKKQVGRATNFWPGSRLPYGT